MSRISLRRAAREVGISPNGLRNFLNGAAPRLATRGRLEQWLAEHTTASRPPAVGQMIHLLHELAADLSVQQVSALARDIASLLAAAYEQRRLTPPRWVSALSRGGGGARESQQDSESVA